MKASVARVWNVITATRAGIITMKTNCRRRGCLNFAILWGRNVLSVMRGKDKLNEKGERAKTAFLARAWVTGRNQTLPRMPY